MKYWLFVLLLSFSPPAWTQAVLADVTQPLVAITVGFSGAEAMVFGMLDAHDNDVIVVLRGPDQTINLRRKERILGLWLNGPARRFTQVPGFYGVAASKPVTGLLPLEELKQNRIGLPALQNSLESTRTENAPRDLDSDRAAVIAELARHGLIVQKIEPIRLLGGRLFKVSFALPSNVPVGPFQVTVFAIKDRQIVGVMTTPLITSQIGIAADIHDWAHKLPWAYAFASLGLAVLMGGMGFWAFRPR